MIENEQVYVSYVADGVQREWEFPHSFVNPEDVALYIKHEGEMTKIEPSQYVFNEETNKVTYPKDEAADAVPSGDYVLVCRETPISQEEDSSNTNFKSKDIERIADKLTMIEQELADKLSRAIAYDPVQYHEVGTNAKDYIDLMAQYRDSAAASSADAANSKTQAAASATAAATSAQNAATSESNAASSATAASNSAAAAAASEQHTIQNEELLQEYVDQAEESANTAVANATQAASSATSAANSAASASQDAESSSASAATASQAATSASSSASAASASASNAQEYSSTATQKASEAASSATNAANSATAASSSETNAADSATSAAASATSIADSAAQIQQNKEDIAAIDAELEDTRDFVPPSDWVDIRSGALPNSVYFLVGHSADFSKYPKFLVNATISNSGTYDVFVDGVKLATTASGTDTTLNWQTLALGSGWDVTYPEQFRTHIVRVTPTTSSNTLSSIKIPTTEAIEFGLLWVHFSISYAINIDSFLREAFAGGYCYLLEAITANGNELNVTGNMGGSFFRTYSLKTIPTLVGNGSIVYCNRMFGYSSVPVVKLKNILLSGDQVFWNCSNLKKIETQNSFVATRGYVFQNTSSLTKLPPLFHPNNTGNIAGFLQNCTKLKDTCLDFSGDNTITSLQIGASSNGRIDGLKALTVSNEAPFNNATSPQLNVSYTGLDRQALRQLFKSMPYNVGYTVVGSPTITDGVASGFSERTNYLTTNLYLTADNNSNFEFYSKFTTGTLGSANQSIITISDGTVNGYLVQFRVLVTKRFQFITKKIDGTLNATLAPLYIFQDNTTYYAKAICNNLNLSLKIYDSGLNIIEEVTADVPSVLLSGNFNTTVTIGSLALGYNVWNGSIDLNATYIKVNGIPWFRGTAAMTKTCSVVGCTGTADLTAEDKAIATDKGWALTLS